MKIIFIGEENITNLFQKNNISVENSFINILDFKSYLDENPKSIDKVIISRTSMGLTLASL